MIDTIESRRVDAGISQKALCERAGIHATTYTQLKRKHRGAYAETLQKLSDALDQLKTEKGKANG